MPQPAFFQCPHCTRAYQDGDPRFPVGRVVACPACGGAIRIVAPGARRDGSPTGPLGWLVRAAIVAGVLLGGRALLARAELQSWRERTVSGRRFTRAEALEQGEGGDLAEALLLYDLSLPGIHGDLEGQARERSSAIAARLAQERPGFLHADALLSEPHDHEPVTGDGRDVGMLRLRGGPSGLEVHLAPAVLTDGIPTFPAELGPATLALVLPWTEDDPDEPVRGAVVLPPGSACAGLRLELAAVRTKVLYDAPQTETILQATPAVRVHLVGVIPR